LTTLFDALAAYRICAKAEGKSPKTIKWVTSSVSYFSNFLGDNPDIEAITGNDLRRFIISLQDTHKFCHHPFNKPQQAKLSPQSINTYCRAIRAFFGYLYREDLIESNPMEKVKMLKVPRKVVPTFSDKEIEKLLAQPDKQTDRGYRDYALLPTFVDTGARLSEIANLRIDDVDLEQGYLKAMGKGSKISRAESCISILKTRTKVSLIYRTSTLC
jgi:integrase/recombinase XerD